MRNKTKQNFYLYYMLENSSFRFLYTVRNCKRPEQTKEYKKLKNWLDRSTVHAIGWSDQGYFEDYKNTFVDPNLTYLQIN